MTLKSFPRGGKKPYNKKPSASLFEGPIKKKKHRTSDKKKDKEASKEDANFIATTAERLSFATIQEGLVILGCVHEITECELIISIPGGLLGRALATDISESYTNLLESIVKSEDSQSNEFKPLSELYHVGDYVVCYVKNIQPEEKWKIGLSLEPKAINQNVDINYLSKGSKVVCAVNSVEDHGYVVDIGISNVRAFIPKKQVDSGAAYFLGKQLICNIKEIKTSDATSTITLSTKQKYVSATHASDIVSLDTLTPGTKFTLEVTKVLSNGLQVSFGENHIGYINRLYLSNPLSAYVKEMELTGTLLYILPTVKFGYFSLLSETSKKDVLKPGDIIDNAEVLFRECNGIVVQLTKTSRGFISLRKTGSDFNNITSIFVPGTTHKCRILSYNLMEKTYFCTTQRDLLEEKYFSLSDFKPGDIVNAEIKDIKTESSFVYVQVGKFRGYVAPEQISDAGLSGLKKLQPGKQVQARILALEKERNRLACTLKRSLIKSDLPILCDIRDAQCGSQHHGTIIKINKFGLLIKFFGDVKAWVPRDTLDQEIANVNWNYTVGQTVLVKIETIEKGTGKMTASVVTQSAEEKQYDFAIGEQVEGTITDSSVKGVYLKISKNDGNIVATGYLPAGHMSPCMEIGSLLASKCIPGDTLSALVFATKPSLILTRTFVPQEDYRDFDRLQIGDCLPCSIRDIAHDGIRVILPVTNCTPLGFIRYSNVSNFNLLRPHQVLFAKIISINKKEQQLGLSMVLRKICNEVPDPKMKILSAVDALSLYFNKLSELAKNFYYMNRPISKVTLGQRVTGKVEKITTAGLVVQLEDNLLATVSKDHYSKNFKVGDNVSGIVIWKNYVNELVQLTLQPALKNAISPKQNKLPNIPTETAIRGEILMVTNWFVLVVLKGPGKGSLAALPTRHHVNDLEPNLSPYIVRSRFKCYVVLNRDECDVMPICMLQSAFDMSRLCPKVKSVTKEKHNLKRKDAPSDNEIYRPSKTLKVATEESNANDKLTCDRDEEVESNIHENGQEKVVATNGSQWTTESLIDEIKNKLANNIKNKKRKSKKIKEEEQDEENDVQINNKKIKREKVTDNSNGMEEKLRIPECGFYWDDKANFDTNVKPESSSDSEEEAKEQSKQKKKKLTAAERRERERQKEREIREREEALASNQLPNSVDQFDRLVLASPDSSMIWLQYMAYHLQATEIDKARAVAKRAIKTINFREENEKLNVWNAWLNLESKFGTPETLNDVFQEAVRTNEAQKVYTHMLTVHVEAGRQTELEKLVNTMIGKFKQDPEVWIECGTALLNIGLKDKSRHIMQRALQSLPASQHVNLMVRFANLENKLGDKERSQTLFEQILSSYPKRVDVWSAYVDSLIKSEDTDIARKVLERAVVQTLPARKMKSLFKKFISFEERYGTPEGVARVQQMAVEYVEKQCNKESV